MPYYTTIKENIITLLADLGFTIDKIVPLIVVVIIIYIIINKKIKPLKNIEAFIIRLCGAIETGGSLEKLELYKPGSPLRITPLGMETLEKIGFKSAIENNQGVLFKIIDKLKPRTALDVESTCVGLIRYLMVDKKNNVFNEVEGFLYNNPEYNTPEYLKTAGLYLRDKYLEKHKELLPPPPKND